MGWTVRSCLGVWPVIHLLVDIGDESRRVNCPYMWLFCFLIELDFLPDIAEMDDQGAFRV